jgi:hypothetical protein
MGTSDDDENCIDQSSLDYTVSILPFLPCVTELHLSRASTDSDLWGLDGGNPSPHRALLAGAFKMISPKIIKLHLFNFSGEL